jgi:hypothetical protein
VPTNSTGSLKSDGFTWGPPTGAHRYVLEQTFDREGPSENPALVVALNPAANTIDGYRRSDTCRKAKLWIAPRGFDGIIYLNLFTAIDVLSGALSRAEVLFDPAAEDTYRREVERASGPVIAAWGTKPRGITRADYAARVAHILELAGPRPVVCLGTTATGDPRHPRSWTRSSEAEAFTPDPRTGRMVRPRAESEGKTSFTIDDAIVIAAKAHREQRDKGRPNLPYVTHPLRVMAAFDDAELQMIAVLHDAVEDSALTLDDLADAGASPRVVSAIEALTHRDDEPDESYWLRVRENPDALLVKLADVKDNSDPARLALLPPEVAARLEQKYARAIVVLTS